MASLQLKNQHLLWRAGFGPAASQLASLQTLPTPQLYKALREASDKRPPVLDATDNYLKGLVKGIQEEGQWRMLEKEDRRALQQKSREGVRNLNLLWLDEMVYTTAQLREKMAFFWHGHFAARNLNVFYQQQLLDVVRRHALGSFRELLHAVSKSAAMINFLNAQQNRKNHPNENFAREVMELFTIGRGQYTETDVKEAARAFTGWGANLQGEFVFRRFQHDGGVKTVLGRSGNLEGDDVLDILLEQKETAKHLAQKIYRFFVNDKVDVAHVEWLANRFYQSDYDIGKLADDIFTADWFYDEKNIGVRIKSPVELLVGIRRLLPMEIENEEAQLLVQKLLGQLLFNPPNVAGWPGGRTWIDSSTLMLRLRLPQLINDRDALNVQPKRDDDQMMGRMEEGTEMVRSKRAMGKIGRSIEADIDWNAYLQNFSSVPNAQLPDVVKANVLQTPGSVNMHLVHRFADNSSRETYVKSLTLQLMSTPEYQLC